MMNQIEILEKVVEDIKNKVYLKEDFLPPESELANIYSVEREVIQRVLEILTIEGVLAKYSGNGYQVRINRLGDISFEEDDENERALAFIFPTNIGSSDYLGPFNSTIFHVVESRCRKMGYKLHHFPLDRFSDPIEHLINRYDGAFLVNDHEEIFQAALLEAGFPSVVINGATEYFPLITSDSVNGVYQAVRELFRLGHQEIAYLGGVKHSQSNIERFEGYRKAFYRAGRDWRQMFRAEGDWSFLGGYKRMNEILDSSGSKPITAIFCCNDIMALGAIEAIENKGLRVPEDISVVGFDGIEINSLHFSKLSSVIVDSDLLGRLAFQNLYYQIETGLSAHYRVQTPALFLGRKSSSSVHSRQTAGGIDKYWALKS